MYRSPATPRSPGTDGRPHTRLRQIPVGTVDAVFQRLVPPPPPTGRRPLPRPATDKPARSSSERRPGGTTTPTFHWNNPRRRGGKHGDLPRRHDSASGTDPEKPGRDGAWKAFTGGDGFGRRQPWERAFLLICRQTDRDRPGAASASPLPRWPSGLRTRPIPDRAAVQQATNRTPATPRYIPRRFAFQRLGTKSPRGSEPGASTYSLERQHAPVPGSAPLSLRAVASPSHHASSCRPPTREATPVRPPFQWTVTAVTPPPPAGGAPPIRSSSAKGHRLVGDRWAFNRDHNPPPSPRPGGRAGN